MNPTARRACCPSARPSPTVADGRADDSPSASAAHQRRPQRIGDPEQRFLTTVTVFQAPQNVQVAELRLEAWYPQDAATAEACRRLTAGG